MCTQSLVDSSRSSFRKYKSIVFMCISDVVDVRPIQNAMELHSNMSNSISCCVPRTQFDQLQEELSGIPHIRLPRLSA